MIAWMIGTAAGVGVGWYGHKANLRIAAWGQRVNEQDQIFQQMHEGEGGDEIPPPSNRQTGDAPGGTVLVNSHYPATAAASK